MDENINKEADLRALGECMRTITIEKAEPELSAQSIQEQLKQLKQNFEEYNKRNDNLIAILESSSMLNKIEEDIKARLAEASRDAYGAWEEKEYDE